MGSILIIGDDTALSSMLGDYFAQQNMDTSFIRDRLNGLDEARCGRFDGVLLNINLPRAAAFDKLRRSRRTLDISILMLPSTGGPNERKDVLEWSDGGSVLRGLSPDELVTRIQAILRGRMAHPVQPHPVNRASRLLVHGFNLDVVERSAKYRGNLLALTDAEFALLEALLESPGTVLGREYLTDRVFRRSFHPNSRGLDMVVSRLRRKLELDDNPGVAIRTIRSSGYVFSVRPNE
jgi:two-component system response regulator CpxR